MTEHSIVRLVIRTYRGTRGHNNTITLIRDVHMSHLPGVGEDVAVTEDDDLLIPVTRRRWAFNGQTVVYLRDLYIDPGADTHIHADEVRWETEHRGDPVGLLRGFGWEHL